MINKLYKTVRFLIVTALLLVLVIPAALHVLLSVPAVHTYVSKEAGKQLSILLDSKVSIESVNIAPFNKLTLRRVVVEDCKGDTALKIRNLGVGVSLRHLIASRKIVVDYLSVIRPDIKLSRDSLNGQLNIQNIIEALKPKDPSKPPTDIKLQIRAIVIRDASVSYDVASLPYRAKGFDVNHLSVDNLSADLRIPEFVTENGRRRLVVDMPRMALDERSGIKIERISTRFDYSPGSLAVNRLEIEMPGSLISFNPIELNWAAGEDFPSKESLGELPLSLSTRPECRINPSDA
ncbi:MAG: AsmA family protein, partial [Paramuribaculum sp.]|nr:AsmA family protein [Paramuribaculum sp.]